MARAYSVWLVVRYEYDAVDPIIAFTVKHEMVTWLRTEPPEKRVGLGIIRMPDGTADAGKTFTVEEMIAS